MIFPALLAAQQPAPPPAPQQQEDKLEPVQTSITVVGKIEAEAPAHISTENKLDLDEVPGINLDDRLRNVPGFSLFRRSSSQVANPTTQGVSLRGIGSTGASRTLVLFDGIPMNDPFGGWVYWTRFAPGELERVEISRGASTSAFGNLALGGVIGLFSRTPQRRRILGSYEGGNRNSHELQAGYTDLWSRWGLSASGRAYTSDGYFIVPADRRGSVDNQAGVRFATGGVKLDYLGGVDRFFARLDILAEERRNGTVLQNNSSGLGTVAAHYERAWSRDEFSVLGYWTSEQFHSSFSAVSASRNFERLTFTQTVPSEGQGADALWRHKGSGWSAIAGADFNRAHGFSTDHLVPTGLRIGGGTLLQHGVFGQLNATAGPLQLFGGLRQDFTGQESTFVSPSGGFVMGRGRIRARGSVYRSFRAPTLNELFREFRVGNVVTRANSGLRPETLFGAEAGVDFTGERSRVRVTAYRNSLDDLISNVTLSSTPSLIVRQRRNAQTAINRGVEVSGEQRWRNWRGEAAYLFVDSRYLSGARVAQVPRHQGSAQLTYARNGTQASLGVRSVSAQFEDDLNTFLLPGFATLQMAVQHSLTRSLFGIGAFENLLDRQYLTGFTPTPTIGAPRLWRLGLRWEATL